MSSEDKKDVEQKPVSLGVEETVALYDVEAESYEVFCDKSMDSYLGCADTIPECQAIAKDWILQTRPS